MTALEQSCMGAVRTVTCDCSPKTEKPWPHVVARLVEITSDVYQCNTGKVIENPGRTVRARDA